MRAHITCGRYTHTRGRICRSVLLALFAFTHVHSGINVDSLMNISDPSADVLQVLPEDILRAYGEIHKTFYRLRGAPLSREQELAQHKMWASTACDLHLHALVFTGYWEPHDLESYDDCLRRTARIYAAVLPSTRTPLSEVAASELAQACVSFVLTQARTRQRHLLPL